MVAHAKPKASTSQANCCNERFSKKKGAFFYFMIKVRRENSQISHDEELVYRKAMEEWQQLSAATRDRYKDIAHRVKIGELDIEDIESGNSIQPSKDKFKLLHEKRDEHNKLLDSFINLKTVRQAKFHVISSKIHFETDRFDSKNLIDNEALVYPAEIVISTFNVLNGQEDHYHRIICLSSNKIPLGYRSNVKDTNATHHIPIDYGQDDFVTIAKEINEIIAKDPIEALENPLYCLSDEAHQNRGVLNFIREQVRRQSTDSSQYLQDFAPNLQIFDDLLKICHSKFSDQIILQKSIHEKLTETSFDLQIIGCELHAKHLGMRACALRSNLKIIYLFLDLMCPLLQIEITENHLPQSIYDDYHIF
ncbi:MAG: hypothetical protein MHMPM18_004093 [Marteilia pararefringens]